ncbi:TonB-dependent receptor plug domain-containing protein [Sphingobium sp.]|uniref:TonB-dependent receptor plug domain-containing protein n=1 Tax=Sphingobium sp. TaxID=1912891 RepID=UPI0035C75976
MALGLACAGLSAPAIAQDADAEQSAQIGQFADIIVTANRREEGIQKVATAVTALNSDMLREQNISSASDLLGRIPSLNVTANGQQREAETITIRGQGQTYLAPTGVVNYFAEVPLVAGSIIGNQGGPGTMFDIESLQVLRGPQGTLFGKNTTGGALLIGPKKPTDRFEGWLSAQIGNYNDREFEAVVNAPIIADKLMVRFSFKKVDRDGYTKDVGTADLPLSLPFQGPGFTPIVYNNSGRVLPGYGPNTGISGLPGVNDVRSDFRGRDYDDRHYWVGRIGILFRPTDGIENYLVANYAKSHNNGTGQILDAVATDHPTLTNLVANSYGNSFAPGSAAAFTSANSTIAQAVVARQKALGARRTSLNQDQFYRLETYSIVDTLSIQLSDSLTFRNQESATIGGIEIDASVTALDMANHALTIAANVAFIESEINLDAQGRQLELDPNRELQGQSPFLANLQFAYDHFPSAQKVTLLANYFDDRIDIVAGRPDTPIYEVGRATVNLNYEKEFANSSKISFKAKNLLDEEIQYEQNGRIIESYSEGTEFSVGYTYKF